MIYEIKHITRYDYAETVNLCYNTAIIKPMSDGCQRLLDFSLNIAPYPEELLERVDFYGNNVIYFSMAMPHKSLEITAFSRVEKMLPGVENLFAPQYVLGDALQALHFLNDDNVLAKRFIFESPMVKSNEAIRQYAQVSFKPNRSVTEAARELMQRIFEDFEFMPDFTTVSTPVAEVFESKKGVCQDFAHLAVACVRSVGLPAKYISGYLETLPPPGQEKLVGADASHAWFAVYVPGSGWHEYDPTNNMIPGRQHVSVASGRDYADITPVKGVVFSGGGHVLNVSVDVRRV